MLTGPELLEKVVEKVPPPEGDPTAPLRALIYDSYYDKYRGAIPSIRVVDGTIRKGTKITFGASESVYEVDEVGYNQLRQVPTDSLGAGEVGYTRFPISVLLEMAKGACSIDLAAVRCPVLLVNGSLDDVVDPFSADVHQAGLVSATVRRHVLQHTGHVATHGPQVAELATLMLEGPYRAQ